MGGVRVRFDYLQRIVKLKFFKQAGGYLSRFNKKNCQFLVGVKYTTASVSWVSRWEYGMRGNIGIIRFAGNERTLSYEIKQIVCSAKNLKIKISFQPCVSMRKVSLELATPLSKFYREGGVVKNKRQEKKRTPAERIAKTQKGRHSNASRISNRNLFFRLCI